jgi:hypothetical protein
VSGSGARDGRERSSGGASGQEYLKCSSCGSDKWSRTCVDAVRIAATAEGYADEIDDSGDAEYIYACAECGKRFEEAVGKPPGTEAPTADTETGAIRTAQPERGDSGSERERARDGEVIPEDGESPPGGGKEKTPDKAPTEKESATDAPNQSTGPAAFSFTFPSASLFERLLAHVSKALRADELTWEISEKGFRVRELDSRHVMFAELMIPREIFTSFSCTGAESGSVRLAVNTGSIRALRAAGENQLAISFAEPPAGAGGKLSLQWRGGGFEAETSEPSAEPPAIKLTQAFSAKLYAEKLATALRSTFGSSADSVRVTATPREAKGISLVLAHGEKSAELRALTHRWESEPREMRASYSAQELCRIASDGTGALVAELGFSSAQPLRLEFLVPVQGKAARLSYFLAPSDADTEPGQNSEGKGTGV